MSVSFPCSSCARPMVVQHLRPGELAHCRVCGMYTPVPGDAASTDEPPDYQRPRQPAGGRPTPLDSSDTRLQEPSRAERRQLIERLTREAEQDPAGYRRRVLWLVAQGYGYLVGSFLTVLALLALLVLIAVAVRGSGYILLKAAAPLLLVAIAIGRSMWVRFPEPAGRELPLADFPALRNVIENVRSRAGAPHLHRVLLTNDFNAAVVQRPTLGPIGPSRSYLLLGLPLLVGLSVEELTSVLAHEFGHLSRSHGHFGAWIYRLRSSWFMLSSQLEQRRTSLGWFQSFFVAFLPRFDATTFVLARQNEYEADEMSAALVGARTAGSALARHVLLDRMVQERFWKSIDDLNSETGRAPEDIEARMAAALHAGVDEPTARAWLEEALHRPTDLDDTHPSLAERLQGLGVQISGADVAGPIERSAADQLLGGDFVAQIQAQRSAAWHEGASDRWRSEYEQREAFRRKYLDLKERAQLRRLPRAERGLYRTLVSKYEGMEAGIRVARQDLDEQPDDHMARLHLGMMLLDLQREEGLDEIGTVVEREPALAVEECQRAYHWLFAQGRSSDADGWHEAWSRCVMWREQGSIERSTVNLDDEFLPATLPDDSVKALQTALAPIRGVRSAWFVRKRVTVLPSEACHILILWPGQAIYQSADRRRRNIVAQLEKTLPKANWKVMVLSPKMKPLLKKLDQVPGARLR